MLNAPAAKLAESWLSSKHVDVRTGIGVQAIEVDGRGTKQVRLSDGSAISADIVIIATGVRPNLELVAGTSIATDHGILVDEQLQTNVAGIFAAGDAAQGPVRFGAGAKSTPFNPRPWITVAWPARIWLADPFAIRAAFQ